MPSRRGASSQQCRQYGPVHVVVCLLAHPVIVAQLYRSSQRGLGLFGGAAGQAGQQGRQVLEGRSGLAGQRQKAQVNQRRAQ